MIHHFNPTILREYDIRGITEQTLFPADAYALGRALGSMAVRAGGQLACVGRDGRLTSPLLEAELVRGLTDCGLRAVRIGCGPTPMLYFAQRQLRADVAVMVTGSHNPPDHNGFKIMMDGKPFYGAAIKEVGRVAAAGEFVAGKGEVDTWPALEGYVDRLVQDWDGGSSALNVVWDAGNGAAGEAMRMLTSRLPGRHSLLFAEIDGEFPNHHPDPTDPATLEILIDTVRRQKADLGIAFDGDGDRIGVVDSQGRILWGDQLLQFFAADILAVSPGATIIADVKASQTLFDAVAALNGRPLMWKTGHSLIKSKMAETGALLAGEMSGHIFFADRYYGYDDALYAAVRFLGVVSRIGEPLAAAVDRLPKVRNSPEQRYACPDECKQEIVAMVRERLLVEGADVDCIDGVRVRRSGGWWLLRASNTQAVLVARAEALGGGDLDDLQRDLESYLSSACAALGCEVPQRTGGH